MSGSDWEVQNPKGGARLCQQEGMLLTPAPACTVLAWIVAALESPGSVPLET